MNKLIALFMFVMGVLFTSISAESASLWAVGGWIVFAISNLEGRV